MSLDQTYRNLISGNWSGPVAAALRGSLTALEHPYRWAITRKNLRFDRDHAPVHTVPAPVVSVGNLTVGGTGKSPFVAWLARWFQSQNVPVSIISRGYGSKSGVPNDEALELACRLPDVPHVQNRDRVAAARAALSANPHQLLVLDDAFQHRRLARDLDIVLLDALAPFGYEHLLPRGLLREPIEALARAHVVALSRSDAITEPAREKIRRRVQQFAPHVLWLELTHEPTRFTTAAGQQMPLCQLQGQAIAALCGIGNPAGFRHTLAAAGLTIAAWRELPDHCPYGPAVLRKLDNWAADQPAAHILCTRKDLVKIRQETLGGKPLLALDIELRITCGQPELEARLAALASRSSPLSSTRRDPTNG